MIEFQNVELGYGNQAVLKRISCSISESDYVGLVGPNGCGKTTFLRGILGLIKPMAGQVKRDQTKSFAYVPQVDSFNLVWPLSVREVVALALRSSCFGGRIGEEGWGIVESLIDRVGIASIADKKFSEVSGGQRQRAILAQALTKKPDVLLLDEPTRGLDVVSEHDFLNLVSEVRKQNNLTILLVTHTLQIPLNHAQRVFLFKDKEIIATSSEDLVKTKKLENIYGMPFVYHQEDGFKWVYPARGRS